MAQILCIRMDWNHTAIPLPISNRFYTLQVNPEPEYPFGRRGLAYTRTWQQLQTPKIEKGMLLLDGDVAIDPLDHAHMLDAIHENSAIIHTAPVYLWPISTHVESWVWGFGKNNRYTQNEDDTDLDMFTFSYTYLPRKLIEESIEAGMAEWQYPRVDKNMWKLNKKLGIEVHVVWDADAKHLNY